MHAAVDVPQGGSRTRRLLVLNAVGGSAVLGSYVWGLANPAGDLWGGVPEGLRPLYTASMLLAAAGYFPFTWQVVLRWHPARGSVAGRAGFDPFPLLYSLVLFPSALWLPLTNWMLAEPSAVLWWSIRVVLALVAVGSLGILVALLALRPREPVAGWGLAVAGCAAFCFQTVVLDAILWPAWFPFRGV
jgi:hypothetical protein